MSATPPPRHGWAPVAEALRVRRSARRGFAAGAVVALAVFGFFVVVPGATRPTALYAGLAVVLGVSLGLLVTLVLVGWRAVRLVRAL